MIIPDPVQTLPSGSSQTDGRKASLYPSARQVTEVSIRQAQAKPEFLFALIFLRKVRFAVGGSRFGVAARQPSTRTNQYRASSSSVVRRPPSVSFPGRCCGFTERSAQGRGASTFQLQRLPFLYAKNLQLQQVFVPAIASGSGRLHWHGCRSRMNPMYPCIQKRTFHPIPLAACPLDVHLPVCLGYIHTVYAPEDKKHHRPSVEWKEFPLHLRVE